MSEYYKLHKKSKIHSNGDGYITKDGHTMFQFDIVQDLNRMKHLQRQLEEAREENEKLTNKNTLLAEGNRILMQQLKEKNNE